MIPPPSIQTIEEGEDYRHVRFRDPDALIEE
jgi:hypothetical protein